MIRSPLAAAALATTLLLGGCSTDEKKDVPLENAAEACAAVSDWWATQFVRCSGATDAVAAAFIGADAGMECADWSTAVADGTTTYDRARALTCLDQVDALTCNQIAWANASGAEIFPYDCSLTMRGSLAADAECTHGFQCASGICDLPAACDAPGACAAAPGLDASCAVAEPYCADGLVCDAGTCVPREPLPAPVALDADCSAAPCVDGAYCRAADDTCVARQTDGTACSATAPCDYGYHCATDTSTCRPTAMPGEPCTFGRYDCAFGAACVTLSTMAPATTCAAWGRLGAKCGLAMDLGSMEAEIAGCVDSWCDLPTGLQGTCTAFTAVGQVCVEAEECGLDNGYRCADDGTGTFRCERLYCDPL